MIPDDAPRPPLLLADAIADWVGEQDLVKGQGYASSAAILGPYFQADTAQLFAWVQGTRVRPYRVAIQLGGGRVVASRCGCPIGEQKRCKHVAAVLLAYVQTPERFANLGDAEGELDEQSAGELRMRVQYLVSLAPEQTAHLRVPMPGYVGDPPTRDLYEQLAGERLRAARLENDWGAEEALECLRPLLRLAEQYHLNQDNAAADATVLGLADALAAVDFANASFASLLTNDDRVMPMQRLLASLLAKVNLPPSGPAPF